MIVVLIGPPGAGKSKQSELLRDREHVIWLSAGQLLRQLNDPQVNEVMNSGEMVDDDFVNQLIGRNLDQADRSKVAVLDGFPRHETQAEWLLGYCAETGRSISCVIHLKVASEVSRDRLRKRGEDRDNETSVNERLEEYAITIEPLVGYFESAGIDVKTVNGDRTVEEVFKEIDGILHHVHQG